MLHAGSAPRSAAALALSLGLLVGATTPALAADETDRAPIILYQVRDGETLTGIAGHLLRDGLTWRHLKAINQLDDADRLRPGQELRVPRTWLREETLEARLGQASGEVQVDGAPAVPEARLRAGSTISTGSNGIALVTLPDGTIVRVAPESRVRVERLRRARSTKGIEVRFDVEQGEVQVEAPEQPADEGRRIELRTPKAVAAVRGTRFRVREMPGVATNAVLRGEVAWIGRELERSVQAGFGSSADPSGRTTEPEPLLPAPVITVPETPLRTSSADIRFEPVSGAARYRVLVSRDRAALQALGESVLVTNAYTFESPDDGSFYLHVRAISETGIDGYGSTARFLVAARPRPPEPGPDQTPVEADEDGQAVLRWPTVADARAYRIQLSEDRSFASPLLERRVGDSSLTVICAR